jgi:hypothetical protein
LICNSRLFPFQASFNLLYGLHWAIQKTSNISLILQSVLLLPRIKWRIMKYLFRSVAVLVGCLTCHFAHADVTVVVNQGSTPTCLGRLYSEIIVPGGYGISTDTTAATRLLQTDEGALGLTIFFEVRPNGSIVTESQGGQTVMQSIGFTALNRNKTTGFVSSHLTTFKAITKNMSAVWVNTNDGSGNLQSGQMKALPGILNEAPTSPNCNGLVFSLEMAQNISRFPFGGTSGFTPAVTMQVGNSALTDLWFNSTGNLPSSNAYFITKFFVPLFGGGTATWSFFGQTGVQLKVGAFNLY